MVFQVLYVKADFEEVAKIEFPEDHDWTFDIQQSDGDETRERITVSQADEVEVEGSKGKVNFTVKWPDTKQHSSVNVVVEANRKQKELSKLALDRQVPESANGGWHPVVAFEVRGISLTKWYPTHANIESTGGATWDEVDIRKIQGDDWSEYDEKNQVLCQISNLQWKLEFVK